MVNKQKTVSWFDERKGGLTYSMYGSRNGTDGTADCSGAMTQSVKDAGGVAYDYLYSTITLGGYLAKNGYTRISVNQDWDAAEGDVILMSWGADMSTSGGAGGHVGVMKDAIKFISVDYWTGGVPGTAVSEHNWNDYYAVQSPSYIEVWRKEGETTSTTETKIEEKQEETTMQALLQKTPNGAALHYFDGKNITTLATSAEAEMVKKIYRENNNKEIPLIKVTDSEFKSLQNVAQRKVL